MKNFLFHSLFRLLVLALLCVFGALPAQANTLISVTVEGGARQNFQGLGASILPGAPANYQNLAADQRATLNNLLWRDAKLRMARLWFKPMDYAPTPGARNPTFYKDAFVTSNRVPDARAAGGSILFLLAPDKIPTYMSDTVGPNDGSTNKYIRDNAIDDYAALLADFARDMTTAGIPVKATGILNEAHGQPIMFSYAQWPVMVKALRAALDARSLQTVQIIAPELANNDGVAVQYVDATKADPQAWAALGGFATHSYNMAVTPTVANAVGPDKPFWITEAGAVLNYEEDAGDTVEAASLSSRFLNDMNNRVTHWFSFIGTEVVDPYNNSMRLVKYTPNPFSYTVLQKYYYLKQLSYAFDTGAVFRHSVSDVDGAMTFTYGHKPRVNAAAAINPGGKWAIGLSNYTSNYFLDPNASSWYQNQSGLGAQTFDVKVTVNELAASGTRTFDVFKSVANGEPVAAGQVVFTNGVGTISDVGSLQLVTLREAGSAGGITSNANKHYRIKNRQTGAYLFDAGANASYANSPAPANTLYQWKLIPTASGIVTIKNRSTGEVLNMMNQTGNLQCTAEGLGWYASQWKPIPTDSGYQRFDNRWKPGNYFGITGQTGTAQYGPLTTPPGAFDQWILEEVGPDGEPPLPPDSATYYRIKNRQTGDYIYDGGIPTMRALYSNSPAATDTRYHWKLVPTEQGFSKIVNRTTAYKLHNANQSGTLQSSSDSPDWWSSQWKAIPTDSGYQRFDNRWKPGNYFGIQDQTGLVKYGALGAPASTSNQWILEPVSS